MVKRGPDPDIVRDVSYRDIEPEAAVRLARGADRVVEVPRVLAVDGDEGDLPDVAAALLVALEDLVAPAADLALHRLGEHVGEPVDHHGLGDLRAGVVRVAYHLGYLRGVGGDTALLHGNARLEAHHDEAPVRCLGACGYQELAVHRVAGLLRAGVEVA